MSGRRVTVDLSSMASQEVERLQEMTDMSTSDLFRFALTLMRIYVDSRADGKEFRIVDQRDPMDQTRLELPVTVRKLAPQLPSKEGKKKKVTA